MNAVQLKTKSATNVVIRDASGKKIFDLDLPGCSIEAAVPPDADIQITPAPEEGPR